MAFLRVEQFIVGPVTFQSFHELDADDRMRLQAIWLRAVEQYPFESTCEGMRLPATGDTGSIGLAARNRQGAIFGTLYFGQVYRIGLMPEGTIRVRARVMPFFERLTQAQENQLVVNTIEYALTNDLQLKSGKAIQFDALAYDIKIDPSSPRYVFMKRFADQLDARPSLSILKRQSDVSPDPDRRTVIIRRA